MTQAKPPRFIDAGDALHTQHFNGRHLSRREGLLSLLATALTLAGCGGGGGGSASTGGGGSAGGGFTVSGVSSGGTGSFGSGSVGTVTGFGSIIVNGNGVRIDDSTATVTDEDGVVDLRGKLKLGMRVLVASTTTAAGDVTAQNIVASSRLSGRLEKLDTVNSTFEILGQLVKVTASTAYANLASGFSSVAADDLLEIHGLLDAAKNELTATFIEKKTSLPYFKIDGLVKNLSTVKQEFRIDNQTFTYGAPADLPAGMADGVMVRVRVTPVLAPTALPKDWAISRIRIASSGAGNGASFEVKGRITAYVSNASFSVDNIPVVVPATVTIVNPGLAVLGVGILMEIKGTVSAGVLTASSAKVEDESSLDATEFELVGAMSNFTGSSSAGSFDVKTYSVDLSATTTYPDGTSLLVNGNVVKVNGTPVASPTGTRIAAKRVRLP